MRFLLRFVFWMGIVLYNLPDEGAKPSKSATVTGKTAGKLEAGKQSSCVQDLARCITKGITQNILKSNELDAHQKSSATVDPSAAKSSQTVTSHPLEKTLKSN